MNKPLSAAVVTSSLGRDTLKQTIESVRSQINVEHVRHYVFAHGKQHWNSIESITSNYAEVETIFLPNNNGSDGYGMAPVFAAAPFIVSEDVIFYLDDDNWIDEDHIYRALEMLQNNDTVDWVFSLRKYVDHMGNFMCLDRCENTGFFPNLWGQYLVDNSCYAVRTKIARQFSHAWYYPIVSDRMFLKALLTNKILGACTGAYTTNYRISHDGSRLQASTNQEEDTKRIKHETELANQAAVQKFGAVLPWEKPCTFRFTE